MKLSHVLCAPLLPDPTSIAPPHCTSHPKPNDAPARLKRTLVGGRTPPRLPVISSPTKWGDVSTLTKSSTESF